MHIVYFGLAGLAGFIFGSPEPSHHTYGQPIDGVLTQGKWHSISRELNIYLQNIIE